MGTGSTPVDDWFDRGIHDIVGGQARWLLAFTSDPLVLAVLGGCVAVTAAGRQWALTLAVLAAPALAVAASQWLKELFDRRNGPYLEYPSGHTTLLVTVLGMAVVVAAARVWAWAAAVTLGLLGALGLVACGYHYLTDTVGAALLGSALVCAAARLTSAL